MSTDDSLYVAHLGRLFKITACFSEAHTDDINIYLEHTVPDEVVIMVKHGTVFIARMDDMGTPYKTTE